jgi:AacA4 family aminoglycoside N(6')-acetyltransferase
VTEVVARAPTVTLRPMSEADLPLLHAWLQRPHVLEWWGGDDGAPSLDEVQAHYLPRVQTPERVTPWIALHAGRPIGYAQSYIAMDCGAGWWPEVQDPGLRGIDQFLAEAADLGRGLGTRMVGALLERLFADPAVTAVQVDPRPDNARAIRCYEKAGFRPLGPIVTPDGPALYMLCERAAHRPIQDHP